MSIAKEHASNFEGFHKRAMPPHLQQTFRSSSDYINVEQFEADLLHLRLAAAAAATATASHSTGALDFDNSLLNALDEHGQGLNQLEVGGSSGGMHSLASVEMKAAHAMSELQVASTDRALVDEVMTNALELLLWDGGLGELLEMQPEAGAISFVCLCFWALPPIQCTCMGTSMICVSQPEEK